MRQGADSGRAVFERLGGMTNGMAHAVRGVRHSSTARTSPTRPRLTLWALGEPDKSCLAGTGRRDGGRVYRQFQMAENRTDHLGRGDGGDNPQRSMTAKRKVARLPPPTQWRKTGGHIQRKHPLQQPRPAPVRGGVAGLRLFYALLAWRRCDRPTQQTVRRQTAPIADQVDPRQRHKRHQFLEQFQR